MHGISREQETCFTYQIKVPTYGDPEKVRSTQLLRVAEAVYHGLNSHALVQDEDGNWWAYDPHIHDGGSLVRVNPDGTRLDER